ncbi:MAG TPA: succinate dehydrogenase, cytochrome b556 subunit [Ignavibacteria bacterium]|nr:succinate dehydrogenase, cytochrome b556 subunit [Ignavibacteria bacterium]HRK00342.1 succinate dehydrogenase, cytochrome b556 subunit [Ignavibacteria bacterium]
METDTGSQNTHRKPKTFDQKNWISENLNYKKDSGSWAWILHRITGIALIAYLFLHIYSLSPLTEGEVAFNNKMEAFTTPVFMVIEWLLFAFVLFHSLNGIRIVIVDWADGAKYHKQLYRLSWIVGIILFLAMGAIMFSHELKNLF